MYQTHKPPRIALVSFAAILLLSSCSLGRKSEHEIMSEIYSAVMGYDPSGGNGFIDYCAEEGVLTISSLTQISDVEKEEWQWAKKLMPALEQETWESFFQMNSQPVPFPEDLDLGCGYTLLDIEAHPPGWSRENCTGINYFSQIGFNPRENQALVYRAASCGDFGYGHIYFLQIVDGHWLVTHMAERGSHDPYVGRSGMQ